MKTQHIKFDILKERLSLFYCNLIQHNFVLDMFSIGQICEENFHPFGDVKQFTMNKNAKLVNYKCIPTKSCNYCIISKPVNRHVYKVEKRP